MNATFVGCRVRLLAFETGLVTTVVYLRVGVNETFPVVKQN